MRDILITGASSGLGQALAINFADDKTVLHLTGRNLKRLQETKKLCEKKLAKVEIKVIDVRDKDKMHKYVSHLCKENHLDMIIANAGISGGTAQGIESTEQVYEIFDTNLYGVLNTIQPALPHFSKRKKGKILIISSLAGYIALPSCPAYSASKAAVRFYGNALGDFVKDRNIDVRVVSPGYIKSAMTAVNKFPMPFIMDADEAAKLIEVKLENSRNPNIAFPWPMYYSIWLAGIISRKFMRYILRLLPRKQ
ncbi:MAG: SDR family NAD(P)-dependent oxidoreductase [Rickettsiales bacterium]